MHNAIVLMGVGVGILESLEVRDGILEILEMESDLKCSDLATLIKTT